MADTNEALELAQGWDDLKESLPSDGHTAAELLFDYGDKLADMLTAQAANLAEGRVMERIVAAAIQIDGLTLSLPQPARHGQVMHSAEIAGVPTYLINCGTQGFLTSTGRFVNRVMARHIAHRAGQNPGSTGGDKELFSEDLW